MSPYRKIGSAFIRLFIFWLLFFAFLRASFLFYEHNLLQGISSAELAGVFLHALRLDVSAACWLMVFPWLIWVLQSCWSRPGFDRLIRLYVLLIVIIYTAINVGEMGVYEEWQSKLHSKALAYLLHPSEIVGTAGTGRFLILSLILVLLAGISFYLYRTFFSVVTHIVQRRWTFSVIFVLIPPAMLLIGLRGGLQEIPVNESTCYFSRKEILNHAATNSGWSLLHSVIESRSALKGNPFNTYPESTARACVDRIQKTPCDSTVQVLTVQRPNIVLILLEGWSASVLESLGGDPGFAPFTDQLCDSGLLFTRIFNTGTRSQQGISGIFSGYPAFPYSTITQHPEKFKQLPYLTKVSDSLGYFNTFTFGGSLTYGNLRSYLSAGHFDLIREQDDFPASLPSGKLGIHDEYMFPQFLSDLDQQPEPFFSSLFTVSTHSPYDQDMPRPIRGYEYELPYLNAIHYSDQCLRSFFASAKSKPWYHNTLFILISDHSHSSYRNLPYFDPEYNRIVCLWYGSVLKPSYRGTRIDKNGSQCDLPATLLNQMQVSASAFVWSKDLLNACSPDYAYYSFEVGLGWIRPYGHWIKASGLQDPLMQKCDNIPGLHIDTLAREGQSYLQVVYDDFLKR